MFQKRFSASSSKFKIRKDTSLSVSGSDGEAFESADSMKSSESSSSSSSDDRDQINPEEIIGRNLEKYYDYNYFHYEVQKDTDYINNQVWNLHYDSTYDIIYVFVAKIRVIEANYD